MSIGVSIFSSTANPFVYLYIVYFISDAFCESMQRVVCIHQSGLAGLPL